MATELRIAIDDIPLGGMKQAEDGDAKVLFVRDADGVRAFQSKCPHYGAPLAKGLICGRTLYCPWHKAAFDIGDGSLREPPALNDLQRFPVRIEGSEAIATLTPIEPEERPRLASDKHFVIVGTGAAAVAAATTLRREGFAGRLSMIGREGVQPYDRPKLSKNFLAKKTPSEAMQLEPHFYAALDIEAVDGPAETIDIAARTITLADGRTIIGDAMLIATGSRAATPPIPGSDLGNVFTLRSLADAVAISEAADSAKTLVIIGAGFIGLEAAAFLTKRGLRATVVAPEALPFAKRFGDDVAKAIKAHHEGGGIRFIEASVEKIIGHDLGEVTGNDTGLDKGNVEGVQLEGGGTLPADIVVIGAGARPETGAISGVELREDGGIPVGADLRIAPGVWIAGDIAAFPGADGAPTRIEHWRLAEQHGIHAARGMLGGSAAFANAPFFWSNQGDKRLDYAGHASDWDEIVMHGDPAKLDFIAYYIKGGAARAACAIGQNEAMITYLNHLDEGRVPRLEDVRQTS